MTTFKDADINWRIDFYTFDDNENNQNPIPVKERITLEELKKCVCSTTEPADPTSFPQFFGSYLRDEKDSQGQSKKAAYSFIEGYDLAGFLMCAAQEGIYISVRETGRDSLLRLPEHAACKPHDILEKSLKPKSLINNFGNQLANARKVFNATKPIGTEKWCLRWFCRSTERSTVVGADGVETFNDDASEAIKYLPHDRSFFTQNQALIKRILGLPEAGGEPVNQDDGYAYYPSKCLQASDAVTKYNGYVGYWYTLELGIDLAPPGTTEGRVPLATVGVPMGYLHVGPKGKGQDAKKRNGVPVIFPELKKLYETIDKPQRQRNRQGLPLQFNYQTPYTPPHDCYTGDYDLHCLFKQDTIQVGRALEARQLIVRPGTALGLRAEPQQRPERTLPPDDPTGNSQLDLVKLTQNLTHNYLPRTRLVIQYDTDGNPTNSSNLNDRYAHLIQHGPQNLYYQYVKANNRYHQDNGGLRALWAELELLTNPVRKADEPASVSEYSPQMYQASQLNVSVPVRHLQDAKQEIQNLSTEQLKNIVSGHREKIVDVLLTVEDSGVLAFTPCYRTLGGKSTLQNNFSENIQLDFVQIITFLSFDYAA